MPNIVKITVENPDEIRNAGAYDTGAFVRLQWSATSSGAYADVSGTGSTPTIPILAATRLYTGYDPNGITSTWYRTRYENAGATRLSDWTTAFQVGDETAGLLCSLYDVKQRMFGTSEISANEDETILDIIREVSDDIEDYVGQWLAPRPTDPGSEMTLTFDVSYNAGYGPRRSIIVDRGHRLCGIRSFSAIGIATTDQPDVGGIYTAAFPADVLMRPWPSADGPAYELVFSRSSSGSYNLFYPGRNTLQMTGRYGPAAVAPRVQGVAIAGVTRRYLGKETASPTVALGPDGDVRLLADLSPAMRATLDRMRIPLVA